eukprot:gb/GECG01010224.1/.p1 GENE.gb/GECG01010224.1/~~gb/GECG01010224.1/.p1  ORF type:complete len:234 (+),score=20.86 gb/GECG01010224.1/:1-702(+)
MTTLWPPRITVGMRWRRFGAHLVETSGELTWNQASTQILRPLFFVTLKKRSNKRKKHSPPGRFNLCFGARRQTDTPTSSEDSDEEDGHLFLRGCIGTTSPAPHIDIGKYALKSAFDDNRFDGLKLEELPDIVCSVSLLVKYEQARNWEDWSVGRHGIIIDFERNGRSYHAIYLPEVACEQGWNQRETIEELVRKSGYRGRIDEELLHSISLTRFQSTQAHLSFKELRRLYQLN